MAYETINPATEEREASFPELTDQELETALEQVFRAAGLWRQRSFPHRAEVLSRAGALMEERADALAKLMAREMGKPLAEGVAEAKKSAGACHHYAAHGEAMMREEAAPSDASESYIRHEPLGVVLAIMPWNFPLWQVVRHAAPGLMAGNVILLKHSPNTPLIAAEIEQLFLDAGAPEGVMRNVYISNDQAARTIADPRVAGVTLTGSTRAGRSVARTAGDALKKTVLELGGSDPFIVLEDADVEDAAKVAAASRCLNGGQSCISAKRFIVHERLYTRFVELLAADMGGRRMGNPFDPGVRIGPMARRDLRDALADQVRRSVAVGARVVVGGSVPDFRGFYYPPTVLVDVTPATPAWNEETFGPVAAVMPVRNDEEAVMVANSSRYGLGASLWTQDRAKAKRLAPLIETGNVFVNGLVKSDVRLPFGGIKESGYGRELGRIGMLEFVNVKTVWIR